VITKRNTIEEGVYLEETLTKVLRQNKNFVVIMNNKPYPLSLKKSKCIGAVIDTSKVKLG
jgi:hypothetical protein